MLELRPNCEYCDKDLPPQSTQACICTYECTFCVSCVNNILNDVCPNCGGGFSARPIRPTQELRKGVGLLSQPASTKRIHSRYSGNEISAFAELAKHVKPEDR